MKRKKKQHVAPMMAVVDGGRTHCGLDVDDVVLATSDTDPSDICGRCRGIMDAWSRRRKYGRPGWRVQ